MPPWLQFTFTLLGFMLVVPLWVLGASGGKWREALRALKQYLLFVGALALPAVVVGLGLLIWPPVP